MGSTVRKNVFGQMRTAKAQISLRIRSDQDLHCLLKESLGTVEHNSIDPDQPADTRNFAKFLVSAG